jgi:large subunit ribosomal protein L30
MEQKTKKITKIKKTEEKIEHKPSSSNNLILVIRIDGEVKVKPEVRYTLDIMRLRRKYSSILIDSKNVSVMGMVSKVKYSVAYGEIERDTLVKLLNARAQKIDKKKFNAESVAEELITGKKLDELGFKPFFRLHPPRKGINSKLQYPKGVLGNNKKDINKLVERML